MIIVFIVLLLSAIFAEWQYDEAWTYQSVVDISVADVVLYDKYNIANNHVVNSLYFQLLQWLGVKHVFFYRLISLLSYWLYCYYVFLLLGISKDNKLNWYHFPLLLMPYMIFFASGRGYGLAIAAFMASLYYCRQFMDSRLPKQLFLFVLLGSLASVAIFSFVLPFMAMLLIVSWLVGKQLFSKPINLFALAVVCLVILYVYIHGKTINTADTHIVGTDYFFRNGMLSGIVTFICLYDYLPNTVFIVYKYAFLITLILALATMLYKQEIHYKIAVAAWTITIMIILHYLMGAKYPLYRSVSYILPLLYLPICYAYHRYKSKLVALHLCVMLIIGFTNLYVIIKNSTSADTEDVMEYAAKNRLQLFVSDNLNPNIDLYNKLYHQDSIKIIRFETPDNDSLFLQSIKTQTLVFCDTFTIAGTNTWQNFKPVYTFGTKILLKNRE